MSFEREPNCEPIPGYRLLEPLGSGGFGEVWKCEAPGGIHKAIKFVYGNLNSLDVDGARAEQELQALQCVKEVRHPFVCSLDRIEVVNGELVIVMELAERTLHDLCTECQAAGMIGIPGEDLLRYLRDTAEALDYMNEKHNLQHLDVKPRNLFLIGDHVKVADFGLVKHLDRCSPSALLGGVTALYAPPETFDSKISPHSDQYSLAIVYQELLTGQRPFTGKNVRQLAQQHLTGEPDLRPLPEGERAIVGRALSKDPDKRFPNCMALVAGLYRARHPARAEPAGELVGAGKAGRSKTLAETMEDLNLPVLDLPPGSPGRIDADLEPARPPAGGGLDEMEISQLSHTILQPDTGALRPTLVISVGSFGRKALLELRCRLFNRFDDLKKLTLMRFLCLDTDPESANLAVRRAPEVALSRSEVHPVPLQAVGNYRRRSLEQLGEWLPREKLYAMPRSLQTQGSRALGRLAFSDNVQRLVARLRREIQEITDPEKIHQAVTQTSLALCNTTPRIYVLAAAGGGNSGLLTDLGYALRRQLVQLHHPEGRVTVCLLCGAPNDPATPKLELANVYATLTELNHFSDPAIPFTAEYGAEGQRLVDQGPPFHAAYLLPLAHRSPEALDEAVAHLGSYLFHELTTPLGLRLDNLRQADFSSDSGPERGITAAPFRCFGTYGIWFPRGLLLRLAARFACRRLIDGWLTNDEWQLSPEATTQVHAFTEQTTQDPALQFQALAERLHATAPSGSPGEVGHNLAEAMTALLAKLDEQSLEPVAQDDPGNWARQAFNRLREWVGMGSDCDADANDWRKTRLNRSLSQAALKVAEDFDRFWSEGIFGLMEHAGARLAAAAAALARLQKFSHTAAEGLKGPITEEATRTAQAWKKVQTTLEECQFSGGFRLFASRSRARQLRSFMEALSHFARQRLNEEVTLAVRHFFASLGGRLVERGRDLGFCRQRLRHLQEQVESGAVDSEEEMANTRGVEATPTSTPLPSAEAYWEVIRQSTTARVVLPNNEQDLERAALLFLNTLKPDQWVELDREIHARVLQPQGGLHGACTTSGDLSRILTQPLLEETVSVLGQHLPLMDVAQILGGEFGLDLESKGPQRVSEALAKKMQTYLERAAPAITGKNAAKQQTFLLVPASPTGKAFGAAVQAALPTIKIVRVPGQADLMFCCEQGQLTGDDLHQLLLPCRAAYEAAATAVPTSPHARFDISDWMPLDPV